MTPRTPTATPIVAALLLIAVPAGAIPRAHLEGADPHQVRFRVPFDPPEMVEATQGDRTYRYLAWTGMGEMGEFGAPAIPVAYYRVAVPRDGAVGLAVDVETRGRAGGLRFPPTLSPEPGAGGHGRRPDPGPVRVSVEGSDYRQDASPPWAEITADGIERGLRVVTVAVRPVRWDPVTGEATWASAVTVGVSFSGGARSGARHRPPRPDRAGDAEWRTDLVNPDGAGLYRAAADTLPCPAGLPGAWYQAGGGWLKIHVTANGMYRLGRQQLSAAGIPIASIDPRTFRLYSGPLVPQVGWVSTGWDSLPCDPADKVGHRPHVYQLPGFCGGIGEAGGMEENAILIPGEEDGSFDVGDYLEFYALGPDNYRDRYGLPPQAHDPYVVNPYTDETVYWLTWNAPGLPGPPRRMETVDATPSPGAPEVTQSRTRLHVEQNTFRDPAVYFGGWRWEEWFWDYVRSDEGVKRYLVDLPHLVPGTPLDATVRLWGAKVPSKFDYGEARLHHMDVTVNGADQGMSVWGGTSAAESITPYDVAIAGAPSASPSEFRFLSPAVASVDQYRLDEVYLAWIDAVYTRDLALDQAAGELELDSTAAGSTIRVADPPAGTVEVYDVTDPRSPRRLTGAVSAGGTIAFAWNRAGGGEVALTSGTSFLLPRKIDVDDPPRDDGGSVRWLRETDAGLDYVIVTTNAMVSEAQQLADWRRDHLWGVTYGVDSTRAEARVRVVRVSDIMDEFAWGMQDPLAIRHFLEYAFRYYHDAPPGLDPYDFPLSYCLFLGDATNDPRNVGGVPVPGAVPSWEDNRDDIAGLGLGNTQYVSDDPLARFDDPNSFGCPDQFTDLYIGRITVNTPDQARDLIQNKVLRSERDPIYGRWRTKAILVADDVCQGTSPDAIRFGHMFQTDGIGAALPPEFVQDKIYLYEYGTECIYNSKPLAKQALLKSWSDGAWLVNYIGHGADVVWADEHVLDLTDTPLLTNDGKFPVVGSFSCSVGKFSNPTRDGLGEAHLRAPHGGSLVSLAATHITLSGANFLFNYYFIHELFPGDINRPVAVGAALMHTKHRLTSQSLKYVCLGDPASRISVPPDTMIVSGPSSLDRGTTVSVSVTGSPPQGRDGTLDLEAQDADHLIPVPGGSYHLPGATLYRGTSALTADSASVTFTVPSSLRGGPNGKIAVYASGAGWDAMGALSPLTVGGTLGASADQTGPSITFDVPPGTVFPGSEIGVTLEDPSGINLTRLFEFRSILLKVFDRTGLEQYREDVTDLFQYDEGSSTRGHLAAVVPDLSPAPYTVTLSATDNFNNASLASLDLEIGTPSPISDFESVQPPYPNPFDPEGEPTKLVFSLSRTARVTARIYSVSGRLVRKADLDADAGSNVFVWNGRDEGGDAVANGVYLVQLTSRRPGSDETRKVLERVVVLR